MRSISGDLEDERWKFGTRSFAATLGGPNVASTGDPAASTVVSFASTENGLNRRRGMARSQLSDIFARI